MSESMCAETQDVVGYSLLAQPAVETLRLLLKFSIPDCRVSDFGAGDMECFGLHRNRVRAGSVGFCVTRACCCSGRIVSELQVSVDRCESSFHLEGLWMCVHTVRVYWSSHLETAYLPFGIFCHIPRMPVLNVLSSCPVFGFTPAARDIIHSVHV